MIFENNNIKHPAWTLDPKYNLIEKDKRNT